MRYIGYETAYFGKWHLNEASIVNSDGTVDSAIGSDNTYDAGVQARYKAAKKLDSSGFGHWTGPDAFEVPDGIGVFRDKLTACQAENWLKKRDEYEKKMREAGREKEIKPFLLVVALVNPHDIVFGDLLSSLMLGSANTTNGVPITSLPQSFNESDSKLPTAVADYRRKYTNIFFPIIDDVQFMSWYYYYLEMVDKDVGQVYNTVCRTGLNNNTIVMYTTDHGSMQNSHGLKQKWYNGYEESVHIPLYISMPKNRTTMTAPRPDKQEI